MVFRLKLSGLAAVLGLAGAVWTFIDVNAAREIDVVKSQYHRPAETDLVSDVTKDPVWRLGQKLFFEPRLSASSTMSCASCHDPAYSWTDRKPKATGDAHKVLAFRAPTLLDIRHLDRLGWTGRFPDVETVAFFAMNSPGNMNVSTETVLARLKAAPEYRADFAEVFGDGAITKANVGSALARFVMSIASDKAPFDRWIAGDKTAISESASRGFAIFNGKGKCAECHGGWAFTDGSFHDVGVGRGDDIGRGKLFKTSIKLQYAFKSPTLRNVAVRAPYMHDGSLTSLDAVIDHYDQGGIDRPSRAEAMRPLGLSVQEKADLIAFLQSLTSPTRFVAQASH